MKKAVVIDPNVFIKGIITVLSCWAVLHCVSFGRVVNRRKRVEVPNPLVLIIYKGNFGNPQVDGEWFGWGESSAHSSSEFSFPSGLPSVTFPASGLYSSHDPSLIRLHLYQLSQIGVDGIVLQWLHPKRQTDNDNATVGYIDKTMQLLIKCSHEFNMKVAIQIDEYKDRTSISVEEDMAYVLSNFANDKSYLRIKGKPVLFIRDPYKLHNFNFNKNFYVVGSVKKEEHIDDAIECGFDGIYTFHVSEGDTYCSNILNWEIIHEKTFSRGIDFFPTVGPGYNKERLDTWSYKLTRKREGFNYYDRMWNKSIDIEPTSIIINSFNDWLEGTSIEPVVSRKGFELDETNCAGKNADSYSFIDRTKYWINIYKKQ